MARRKKTIVRSTRFAPTFEALEQRQLLAANVLANGFLENINLNSAGDTHSLQLDVTAAAPVVLAFDMHGMDGLNPGQIAIESVSGHTIAPIASTNGATDSVFLAELGSGSYEITVLGDAGTTGRYDFSVSLVGDLDQAGQSTGDGEVSSFEQMWAQAAIAQSRGTLNSYTASYYAQFGIPVGQNLFDASLDANRNGMIDPTDYSCITTNVGKAGVVIELTNDSEAPVITAGLANDTGVSNTDGITTDVTIHGNVTDTKGSAIVGFKASINSTDEADYVDIFAELDANGDFILDRERLTFITIGLASPNTDLSVALLEDGVYTLRLIATDEYGNTSEQAYTVDFTRDTIAPVAPGTPDLIATSDIGYSTTDNITADNTPTFTITTEAGASVKLFSGQVLVGQGTANASGIATITTSTLADGEHSITAQATDIAGNVGAISTELDVTINTVLPITPLHNLAVASDTDPVGDHYTSLTSVTLEGDTDPSTQLSIVGTSFNTDSDSAGHFSFTGVPLVFGETTVTVRAMSASGAIKDSVVTYTQNNAPVGDMPTTPFTYTENDGPKHIKLTDIFTDLNTVDGDTLKFELVSNSNDTLFNDIFINTTNTDYLSFEMEGTTSGTTTVTIRATDSYGEIFEGSFDIEVTSVNDSPVVADLKYSTDKNEPTTIDLWDYFSDEETADADLVFSNVISGIAGEIDGAYTLRDGHFVDFVPATGYKGLATFSVTVTDTAVGGLANSVTELIDGTVADQNIKPVAMDASRVISEDPTSPLDIPVGDLVSDLETPLDSLVLEIISSTGGTTSVVTVSGVRYFRFTPTENFNGEANFTYKATDTGVDLGGGVIDPVLSDTGTVTITVDPVNDAPIAQTTSRTIAEKTATVNQDPVEIAVATLVSDVETTDLANLDITIDTMTGGTAEVVDIAGVLTFRFTQELNFNDPDPVGFTYSVTDKGDGADVTPKTSSGAVNITITPINDAPVATSTPSPLATLEDTPTGNLDLWTLVSDTETADAGLLFDVVGTNGTVELIDGHLVRFTPRANFNDTRGEASFTYTVTDGGDNGAAALSAGPITINVSVTPVNDAPVAEDDGEKTVPIDEDTTIDVLANDSDPDNGEGETDTLTILSTEAIPSGKGSVDIVSNKLVYHPEPAATVAYDVVISYTIEDSSNAQATAQLTLHVTPNVPPVANPDNASVDENGSIEGNVLTNDTDQDDDDITVIGFDATSAEGVAISLDTSTGEFTYDLSSLTKFDHLAAGETATDTFHYNISDGNGGTAEGLVTITIHGVNDAPVATPDGGATITTAEDTALDIDVLANDTDIDSTSLTVSNLQSITDNGASVSVNPNGTLHYDPSGSVILQNLAEGQQSTDTFTYTANDGSLNSQSVTVEVIVTGVGNDAPQVDAAIGDMSLNDGDDQPASIDLTGVFSDPNGHNLSFTAVSSNTDLVTVQIVGGTNLQVTYLDYGPGQDRTPAVITVTATETNSTGAPLSVSDVFTVTVAPIQPMEVHLIALNTASDLTTATATDTLPTSINAVDVGESYVVEIWAINTYYTVDSGIPGVGDIYLAVLQGDLGFDNTLGWAASMSHVGPFNAGTTASTIDNANGAVTDFGGANPFVDNIGVYPYYSRIGYVTFNATDAGTQDFTFDVDFVSMASNGDYTNLSQVNVVGASVTHGQTDDTYTFNPDDFTKVDVTGKIAGTAIVGSSDTASSSSVAGAMIVTLDDYATPTNMAVLSGSLDVGLYHGANEGKLLPGIGGIDIPAPADFKLLNSEIELAIRDLAFSFTSNTLPVTHGIQFTASDINAQITSGFIDYKTTGGAIGRISLAGKNISIQLGQTGRLLDEGSAKEMNYSCQYTIDLSSDFGANSEMTFAVSLLSVHNPSAPIMGTVAAEDTPTDVAMSVVKDPTATDAKGEVASLPQSETWIDEWDAHWVEVWIKTEEGSGVDSANVDLAYNAEYFTATAIEYSPAVTGDFSGDISIDGIVSGLGGTFDSSGVGVDGYVLLGRVKFESLADDGVDLNVESFGEKPFDLGLELSVNDLNVNDVLRATVGIDRAPTTELWAMPYDANDDDVINLRDVAQFIALFQTDVLHSSNALAQVLDYNNDAKIDLADMARLLANFGTTKFSGRDVSLPDTFTQRWIGSGLDSTGDSTTGELLDAATEIWQDMLGTNDPIDIQLVVTDLGSTQLAKAEILATDENGQPIAGRVTIDDDAAGLGWYSQVDGTPDAAMYDLYTVMLHEIGHTLGFMGSYDGFAENLETSNGTVTFVDEGISVTMDSSGNHVTDASLSDDLMSSTLDPGVRKLPSALDAQMILAAYEAAEGGASGFAAVSASITTADAMQAVSTATADFDRIDGPLVGEMTWAQLIDTRSEKNEEKLDAVDATDALFAYESIETPVAPVRSNSESDLDLGDELAIGLVEELTEETTTDEAIDNAFDGSLFDDWSNLLG